MEQRLHKVLALAGVAARRKCEDLILKGLIEVNGKTIRELGFKVDTEKDKIYCKGLPVKAEKKVYFLLNKPKGYVCTNFDPERRKLVIDLFRHLPYRLYTVGRLDAESEGLIIVTNDGELCNQLSHPRYEVPKTYWVSLRGYLTPQTLEKIQKGVWLSEGKTAPVKVKIIRRERDFSVILITLKEGKKREVRRIFAKFGHKVKALVRVKIGNLSLGNLASGRFKQVKYEFIKDLISKDNQ